MKRLKVSSARVNKLTTKFVCALKPGAYRFTVYATDRAGNVQVKMASNRLVVR